MNCPIPILLFLSLSILWTDCQEKTPVNQACMVYEFEDGLQIIDFEDRSCQDGDLGRIMDHFAKWQKQLLENESLRITPEELSTIGGEQVNNILAVANTKRGPDYRRVKRVFNRLARHTNRKDIKYSFHLIEYLKKPQVVNASVTANGTIFITTAMLEFLESDDGLAFILAHEFAHGENLSQDYRIARRKKVEDLFGGESQISDFFANTTDQLLKPFNQHEEIIADRAALYLMNEAGYDPEVALHIFYQLDQLEEHGGIHPFHSFVSTHPYHRTRFDCLNSYLFESKKVYDPCPYPAD